MKTARAAVSITPELAETLARDGWRVARVHATVLADVEQQVTALRALHLKLRQSDEGPSFGEVVARSPPRSEIR